MKRPWNLAAAIWICAAPCVLLGVALAQQPADFESLVGSARSAQARGDFEAAAGFYRQASTLEPENAELMANLGLMYYQVNKNEEAADAFRRAIRLNPGLFVPNLFLGLDYVKLKRFREAIPYLKHAARSKPQDFHAQTALGQAYSGLGETRPAIRSYLEATRAGAPDADVWYRLGIDCLEQVESDARVLLGQYRDSAYVQALVAENFAEQGALDRAAAAYKRALALPAFPPDTHAGYGFVLLNERDLRDAGREWKSELALNPGSLLAKLGMARLDVEQDSAEQAAEQIGRLWRNDPGFLTSNLERFKTELTQARVMKLQAALEKLVANGEIPEQAASLFRPDAADTSLWRGQQPGKRVSNGGAGIRRSAGELYSEGAYRQCADLLGAQIATLSIRDLRLLAQCAYGTGDYEHAFDAAEKLSASGATRVEGLYWEARSSEKLASDAFAHASEIDSASPRTHVLLGDVYRQEERFEDAEREYRRALILQPQDTGALFGLSLALLGNRQSDQALHVAQEALKNNPSDPELNLVMGEVLCQREDFSDAEAYLKKGLHAPPESIPHVHALLGKVYASTNRTEEAIAELKLALPEDKDGHLYYQIGRLYLKAGDRDSAQRAFVASKRLERGSLRGSAAQPVGDQGESNSQ